MRSSAEGDSFCLATTNPDYNSWVYNWVSYYLKDGIFDESKLGKIRYFLIVDDTPVFSDSEEDLAKNYPDMCYVYNPIEDKEVYVPPMTFCFIGGTIFDNPALIKANPKYLSALKAQTEINRRRLLDGDWHAVPEGSQYFERRWLHKLEKRPLNGVEVRAWDFASEEPSDKNRTPDFTTSVKMIRTRSGEIVIVGDYEESSFDEKTQVYGKYRQRPGQRDMSILRQCERDGSDCTVVLAVDPASAGKFQWREQSKFFMSKGFKVKPDPMPNNKSKLKKFEPFSTACQNGLVSIVESSFKNKQTLEAFYKELENFDGERSSASRKDDIADSAASAYNFIVTGRVRGKISAGESTNTKLADYRSKH
ncbi:putative terminase family protein [Vibrio phage 277E43-1]|nr:putative terminase family protein [Vibrio phage 277E43-1]